MSVVSDNISLDGMNPGSINNSNPNNNLGPDPGAGDEFMNAEMNPKCNLIVNYLPHEIDDNGLRSLFEEFGEIINTKVVRDKTTKKSLGYGFVKFAEEFGSMLAVERMNGFTVGNKMLKVSIARPPSLDIRNCKLYVTNLPKEYTEMDIMGLFQEFGEIIECRLLKEPGTKMSKGVAFVQFNVKQQANNALSLNGCQLEGSPRPLVVKYAEDQHKKKELNRLHNLSMNNNYGGNRFGGGGGGGSFGPHGGMMQSHHNGMGGPMHHLNGMGGMGGPGGPIHHHNNNNPPHHQHHPGNSMGMMGGGHGGPLGGGGGLGGGMNQPHSLMNNPNPMGGGGNRFGGGGIGGNRPELGGGGPKPDGGGGPLGSPYFYNPGPPSQSLANMYSNPQPSPPPIPMVHSPIGGNRMMFGPPPTNPGTPPGMVGMGEFTGRRTPRAPKGNKNFFDNGPQGPPPPVNMQPGGPPPGGNWFPPQQLPFMPPPNPGLPPPPALHPNNSNMALSPRFFPMRSPQQGPPGGENAMMAQLFSTGPHTPGAPGQLLPPQLQGQGPPGMNGPPPGMGGGPPGMAGGPPPGMGGPSPLMGGPPGMNPVGLAGGPPNLPPGMVAPMGGGPPPNRGGGGDPNDPYGDMHKRSLYA